MVNTVFPMERRVRGNSHARCGMGENPETISKDYLSLFPGAFSSNHGEDFRFVLEEFIKIVEPRAKVPSLPNNEKWPYYDCYIGDGFSLAYRTFDTQYWPWTPQRRRRIYLVLDLRGERAGKVLFEREGLRGYIEAGKSPWQTIAANAAGSIGANDNKREIILGQQSIFEDDNVAALHTSCGQKCNGDEGAYNENPVQTSKLVTKQPHQHLFENHWLDGRCNGPLDTCTTLTAMLGTGGNNAPFVLEEHDQPTATGIYGYNSTLTGDQSATLGINCGMSTGRNGVIVPYLSESHTLSTNNDACLYQPLPIHDKATRYKGGGPTRKNDGAGNGLGIGTPGDPVPTLSTWSLS